MRLVSRLLAVLHRPDDRERSVLVKHRAAMAKAAAAMPGDETLKRLLAEADKMLRGELPQ